MAKKRVLFTLPEYKEGKVPFVRYSYRHPVTGWMVRVKVYEGFSKLQPKEWTAHAHKLIAQLTTKLQQGYDPFKNERPVVADTYSIAYYCDDAIKQKQRWRKNSRKSYEGAVRVFKEWLQAQRKLGDPVMRFTEDDCIDYLDWLENHKGYCPTTRNNHRAFMATIFNIIQRTMRKKKMPIENYFLLAARVPEDRQGRKPFSQKQTERIRKYLIHRDPELWLACLFVRYAMVRTTAELPKIKMGDIDIEKMKLTVHGEVSKNHRTQRVFLHPAIIELMHALCYFEEPAQHYVFSLGRKPGALPYGSANLTKRFSKCRDALNFSRDYSMYSLKHTGNAELHEMGTPLPKIRDQNRHSDIRTTDIYSKQYGFYNEENVWGAK